MELDHIWSQLNSHIQAPVADDGQALEVAFSRLLRVGKEKFIEGASSVSLNFHSERSLLRGRNI